MRTPYEEIFEIVRRFSDPKAAFEALLNFGKSHATSPFWNAIPTPDVEADIDAAVAWLRETILPTRPTGVYLGLDTLNEDEGTGKNLEIGITSEADPERIAMEWAWLCEDFPEDHLIHGMYEVHSTYDDLDVEFEERSLADYLFFFGYSGVVLSSALERLPVDWNSLFVWGFHDGDLAFLAKGSSLGITKLATQSHKDKLIRSAAELSHFPRRFDSLEHWEAARIASDVEAKFGDAANGTMTRWWHCDRPCTLPTARRSFHDGGWRYLTQIAPSPNAPVWLLSENWGSNWPNLVAFQGTAAAVQAVLGDVHSFEYIVVGRELDWLFAEDHHDWVSVAGTDAVKRLNAINT